MNRKRPAEKSKSRIKALLLSALVLPGSGQLYQGKRMLGAGIILISVTSLFIFLSAITKEINQAADRIIRSGNTDMMKIIEESNQVAANMEQSGLHISFYLIIACWIFSAIEVFRK